MATRATSVLGALIFSLFTASTAMADAQIDQPAPDFTATDALSGKPIALHDFKGKLVVLEWNNPECPFVHKFYSVGAMQQMQANATEKGVVWIAINSAAPGKEGYLKDNEGAKDFVTFRHAHPTYYVRDTDGHIGHLFGAKSTPHMFVIDRDGKLAYMGAVDNMPTADPADIATAKNHVTRALRALMDGEAIPVKVSQPYGCAVKY